MEPSVLDIKRQGDLGGTKVAMKFDENSIAHIMSVLTDLYSDPMMAIIREYSTNAWDAHIAAGQTRPIEITTPTQMSPYFKVKDYGIGLSVDDISEIYSKYGASTKRGTNDQVGMLGLGCKSALTYTQQFSLVSIKGGVKATVSISRVEDGTGVMEIVDTRATDEGNGTEVIIPVRQNHQFDSKVERFFSFWKPGTVLVNGKQPEFMPGAMEITPGIMLTKTREDFIVMGNVAYPVKDQLLSKRDYYATYGVVAFVEIGEVNFTPSRENLHYTERTNQTIQKYAAEFRNNLASALTRDVKGAASHSEALSKYLSWGNLLGKAALPNGVTYNGLPIPKRLEISGMAWKYRPNQNRHNTSKISSAEFNELERSLVITDFNSIELTSAQKKKARVYMEEKGVSAGNLFFVSSDFTSPWVKTNIVSWEDVKKTASVKKKSSDNQPFRVYDNGYFQDREELEEDAEIIYFGPRETDFSHWNLIQKIAPDAVILRHGLNRHEKLKREFSGAVHYRSFLIAKMDEALKALTHDDKVNLSVADWDKNSYKKFDITKIDDTEVVQFLTSVKAGYTSSTLDHYNTLRWVFSLIYLSHKAPEAVGNPLLRYPLVNGNIDRSTDMSHVYCYMNAVYQMEQQKENDNA